MDGTEAGVVDNDVPVGGVVSCVTCHNEGTKNMISVVFPSGLELAGLGSEAVCMQCHQGRASMASVNASIEEAGVADDDAVSEELGFINVHYFAAAATQAGTLAQGGYQYEGQTYDARFAHAEGYQTCTECHSPHKLTLYEDQCQTCHSADDPMDIRMEGSLVDYDGDGDLEEGVYFELVGMQELLYAATPS